MWLSDLKIGSFGENIVCGYLSDKGYTILGRNYTTPFGEIDIIAKSSDRMLVFVEVKTMSFSSESGKSVRQSYPQSLFSCLFKKRATMSAYPYNPEMRLDKRKIWKLIRLARWYMNNNFPCDEFRIDGVCVDLLGDDRFNIRHYKNIGFE